MIDNFSGVDTEYFAGWGTIWFLPEKACSDVSFHLKKDRSNHQYLITQGMGQSTMFLTFCTVCNFRGRTLALGRVGGGRGGSFPLRMVLFSINHLTVRLFSIKNSRLKTFHSNCTSQ